MPTGSARPHSETLFRGTLRRSASYGGQAVEMPPSCPAVALRGGGCGEFYQPTCHVSVLRVSSVQRPLQRVCERGVNSPDFCGNSSGYFESFRRPLQEKCRGVPYEFRRICLSRRSLVRRWIEQDYSKNCGFISSFGLGFLPFLPSGESCGRYRQ